MQGTDQSMHHEWLEGAIMCVFQRGDRLTTPGKLLLVPRPWLQLHASGDMCEDIRYGQRIFRLPLSE